MALSVCNFLISERVDASCKKILEENGIKVVQRETMTKNELLAEIKDYDGLIIRSGTKVTADVINAAKNLKIIGRAGTGIDNVDVETSTRNGIIVMNTPNGNTISAAELTCAMIMCLARQIPQGVASMRAGNWERKKFMGMELYGKVLGIVGLGRIGKEVAIRMQSFGMKGVKVINCARGGIIDEEALLRALESGQCGGAGLDVFEEEPPKNLSLVKHPNVVSCPHLGASTHEAQKRCGKDIATQIVDMVTGKSLVGVINAHAVSHAMAPETKPWIQLGEALGLVAKACTGQENGKINVQVTTQGTFLKNAGNCVASAVVVGWLKGDLENRVNLINASLFAKEAGLDITIKHSDSTPEFSTDKCALEISTSGASHKFVGSVQAGVPVLLEIDGAVFGKVVPLKGNLLIYKSAQNPHNLASVVGVLASAGILIESFNVSAVLDGEQWNIMSIAALLVDLNPLRPHVKEVSQLAI